VSLRVGLVLGTTSVEDALAVAALVLVRLGAGVQGHEGGGGVVAKLGKILNMGPVVLGANVGTVQKLGERGAENLELQAHTAYKMRVSLGTKLRTFVCKSYYRQTSSTITCSTVVGFTSVHTHSLFAAPDLSPIYFWLLRLSIEHSHRQRALAAETEN